MDTLVELLIELPGYLGIYPGFATMIYRIWTFALAFDSGFSSILTRRSDVIDSVLDLLHACFGESDTRISRTFDTISTETGVIEFSEAIAGFLISGNGSVSDMATALRFLSIAFRSAPMHFRGCFRGNMMKLRRFAFSPPRADIFIYVTDIFITLELLEAVLPDVETRASTLGRIYLSKLWRDAYESGEWIEKGVNREKQMMRMLRALYEIGASVITTALDNSSRLCASSFQLPVLVVQYKLKPALYLVGDSRDSQPGAVERPSAARQDFMCPLELMRIDKEEISKLTWNRAARTMLFSTPSQLRTTLIFIHDEAFDLVSEHFGVMSTVVRPPGLQRTAVLPDATVQARWYPEAQFDLASFRDEE